MKIFLVGYGNVGKEIHNVLKENGLRADYIVRSRGVYNKSGIIVDEKENFA